VIPAQLLANTRVINNLVDYLVTELRRAQGERAPLEQSWIRYQTLYRAKPDHPKKDFPWPGAANTVIPMVATDVETITARLMGLLFSQPNLWSVQALRPDMVDFAPKLEEFLSWAQDAELGAYDACADWVMDIAKLGTGILKQRYAREQKKIYEFRETPLGPMEQMVRRMVKDNPELGRVALPDFYVPGSAPDIQKAPWCGERLQLSWDQLIARERAGIYYNVSRIGSWWNTNSRLTRGAMYQNAQEALDQFIPSRSDNFEIYEFWLDYDLDTDGEPEAILCTIHEQSHTLLRADFNPFFHQEKPYSFARYIRQEGRFYGIGLGEILEHFQSEITTMHNQRLDNNTVMNIAAYKARRNSVKQDTRVWPGAVILMEDPATDLLPLNMGQKADSTVGAEEMLLNYATRRTGVNDWVNPSNSDSANYATATTAVQMLREGSKRFDQLHRDVRRALSESGTRIVELYQQYNQGGKPYLVLGDEDGAAVAQILQFPTAVIRASVYIDIAATNAQANKEVEVRTNQIVFGLVMQFYQQMMQGIAVVSNPQLPPLMRQMAALMVDGGIKLARRILDAYGIQDTDQIIPDLTDAVNQLAAQLGAFPQPGFSGAGMGQGSPAPSGLPVVSEGAPGAFNGLTPGAPVYGGVANYLPRPG
jgi:hypothetical protein